LGLSGLYGEIVHAQVRPEAIFLVRPASASALPETQALLQRYAAQEYIGLVSGERAEPQDGAAESSQAELGVLRNVERALLEARELSADLREASALRVLAAAEQELLGSLFVPGAQAFLAEVYMQLALCAAQHEELGLFESALSRALSLDPIRRIEAAEAPPAILERARAIARSHDLSPLGESQIETEPPGASAWLDGMRITASDSTFRARAGVHVLVVRAAGYAPYATLLEVGPGKRPALRIALSARPVELARRALQEATEPALRSQRARALSRLRDRDVYLFEVGAATPERALVQRCDASACSALSGLSREGRDRPSFADSQSAHAWLNGRPMPTLPDTQTASRQEKPVWKRWPLWTGTAALVLASVATAVLVTRQNQPQPERTLEIDASALPR
jgi:hypothetical protein